MNGNTGEGVNGSADDMRPQTDRFVLEVYKSYANGLISEAEKNRLLASAENWGTDGTLWNYSGPLKGIEAGIEAGMGERETDEPDDEELAKFEE